MSVRERETSTVKRKLLRMITDWGPNRSFLHRWKRGKVIVNAEDHCSQRTILLEITTPVQSFFCGCSQIRVSGFRLRYFTISPTLVLFVQKRELFGSEVSRFLTPSLFRQWPISTRYKSTHSAHLTLFVLNQITVNFKFVSCFPPCRWSYYLNQQLPKVLNDLN